MKKLVLTGASGFLGSKLYFMLQRKYNVVGTYNTQKKEGLHKLDITDSDATQEFLKKEKPEIILHTAALVNLELCETNKKLAEMVNYTATKNIVEYCKKFGAKLIYISTSYVFDGQKGSYNEDDKCNPINFYGETKRRAELSVLELSNPLILRLDAIYGYNSSDENNGFFSLILKSNGLSANNNQKRQPLIIDDIESAIEILLEKNCTGIYHLGGEDNLTKYELGLMLEKIIRKESMISPIANKDRAARRPKDVSLDTTKAKNLGIKFSSVSEGIKMIEQQYQQATKDL